MAYSDLFAIFSLGGTDIRGWLKYILSRFQFAYAECLSDSGASSGGGADRTDARRFWHADPRPSRGTARRRMGRTWEASAAATDDA